ncbi:MAG: hypothetical protein LBG91_05410 [Treponema sp.]|nr:hypothetical protein [Treponema sp.]
MSIAPIMAPGKPNMPIRYRPTSQEGLHIKYKLYLAGKNPIEIPIKMGLHHSIVYNVITGRRRSKRIEAEIARILGKADWNEVVLEARSEVQKKPVAAVLREMERERQAEERRRDEKIALNARDWGPYLKAYEEQREEIEKRDREERKRRRMAV